MPLPTEKRLADRCTLHPPVECRVTDPTTGLHWLGWVHDLSRTGVSLLLESRISPGYQLLAEIPSETRVSQFFRLTVRHSERLPQEDVWLHGCSLAPHLTMEALGWVREPNSLKANGCGEQKPSDVR
jgi:hypothetical protein